LASIDTKNLQIVLKDFYTLTGMRIGLLDHNAQELITFPSQPCQLCVLTRTKPELDEKCRQCDLAAFIRCQKNTSPHIYTCHVGLQIFIIPLKIDNHILAYIMCGEVIDSARIHEQRQEIYDYLKPYHFPEDELRQAILSLDSRGQDVMNAAVTTLESLALFCLSKQMIRPNKNDFLKNLNEYIDAHLAKPLQISDLCNHFFVSRTQLYKLSQPYLDCSLAEYIQRRRILYATKLLENTDLPITEIAALTGFCDCNYFRRIFKKLSGISAKDCRSQSHASICEEEKADGE